MTCSISHSLKHKLVRLILPVCFKTAQITRRTHPHPWGRIQERGKDPVVSTAYLMYFGDCPLALWTPSLFFSAYPSSRHPSPQNSHHHHHDHIIIKETT